MRRVVRGDTYLQRVINVISLERPAALPPLDAVEPQSARRVDSVAGADLVGEFRVRRVTVAGTGARSWSLLGPERIVVEPVERYLAWLTHIERSPNTVRAYAHDLKLYWSFLAVSGLAWDTPTIESLGEFVAWLRRPAENVVVLVAGDARRGRRTVNRALSAVIGLYEYHERNASASRPRWSIARVRGAAATSRSSRKSRRPRRGGGSGGCASSARCRRR